MPTYYGTNPDDRPDFNKRPPRPNHPHPKPAKDTEAQYLVGLYAWGLEPEAIADELDLKAVFLRAMKRRDRLFFEAMARAADSTREDRDNEMGMLKWLRACGLSYAKVAHEFNRITGERLSVDAVRKRLKRSE